MGYAASNIIVNMHTANAFNILTRSFLGVEGWKFRGRENLGLCRPVGIIFSPVIRVVTKFRMSGHKSMLKPATFMAANVISLQLYCYRNCGSENKKAAKVWFDLSRLMVLLV